MVLVLGLKANTTPWMNRLGCKPAFQRLLNLLEWFLSYLLIQMIRNDCCFCTCVCFDFNILSCNFESDKYAPPRLGSGCPDQNYLHVVLH